MEFSRKGVRYAFGKKNNNQQYKLECGSPKMLAWKVIRSCKWRENAKLSININQTEFSIIHNKRSHQYIQSRFMFLFVALQYKWNGEGNIQEIENKVGNRTAKDHDIRKTGPLCGFKASLSFSFPFIFSSTWCTPSSRIDTDVYPP